MSFLQSTPTILHGIERVTGGKSKSSVSVVDDDDASHRLRTHSTEGLLEPIFRLIRHPTQFLSGQSASYRTEIDESDESQRKKALLVENRKQILYARMSNVSSAIPDVDPPRDTNSCRSCAGPHFRRLANLRRRARHSRRQRHMEVGGVFTLLRFGSDKGATAAARRSSHQLRC